MTPGEWPPSTQESASARLAAFGERLLQVHTTKALLLSGNIDVPTNTPLAIQDATTRLLTSLLKNNSPLLDEMICAFFLSSSTADYPARAAREQLGWHSVPLLCMQDGHALPDTAGHLTILLFAHPCEHHLSHQPHLRGIRGAHLLEPQAGEQIEEGMRWLVTHSLASNHLSPADMLGAIITVTPDLDAAAAQSFASTLLGHAVPLLVFHELAVPHAPTPCIRTLLFARMPGSPQPVYSERARLLLRPDLPPAEGLAVKTAPMGLRPPSRPAPTPNPSWESLYPGWGDGEPAQAGLVAQPLAAIFSRQAAALGEHSPLGTPALQAPQRVTICPSGPLAGRVVLPGSKYHTLRALLAALLAEGESIIEAPAWSDDTAVLLDACTQLGARIQTRQHPDGQTVLAMQGVGGRLPVGGPLTLEMGNAGAVLRLLLGICAASPAAITFTTAYLDSLGRRPNADLLVALTQLGAHITSQGGAGTLPITTQGGKLRGGRVQLAGGQSSQYLSALLYLAPLLEDGLEIEVTDRLVSASFVDLTLAMLQQAGITVITKAPWQHYIVPGGQRYQPLHLRIPGDVPSAAALLAAVAIAKGEITLVGLDLEDTHAVALLAAFTQMGVELAAGSSGADLIARALGALRGLNIDGSQAIDSVPCLTAAACFASTPSHIANIAHLRLKESNRLDGLAAALNALGCQVRALGAALEVVPTSSHVGGVTVDAHNDHRLAQALAVAALGCQQPMKITNAQHIAKSYPRFFDDLASLGACLCSASS